MSKSNYYYYKRKDELIQQKQFDWVIDNILTIESRENILFAFQAEFELLLFTDRRIYFPNRDGKRYIDYDDFIDLKIGHNSHIEVKIKNLEVYTIVLVTTIDKGKIFQILNMLITNLKNGKATTFEDTHAVFDNFTVLKYPLNQFQHKIPQVYLKQFGYIENNQWKVSILQSGENFSRQKRIGSFTAEKNLFDIESEDDRFPRMFEKLNADLENFYHEIIDEVSQIQSVSDKTMAILVQLIPNLMVRSDYWRDFVTTLLKSENKENFLDITFSIHTKSHEELIEIKKKDSYKTLNESELNDSIINRVLLHFLNYLYHHLAHFEIIVIKSPEGKEFFTSDNPVTFLPNQEKGKLGLFSNDTEVYFPLSKDYLAYIHHPNSKQKFRLRQLKNRGIYKAEDVLSDKEYSNLVRDKLIDNADKLIIVPGKINYKREK